VLDGKSSGCVVSGWDDKMKRRTVIMGMVTRNVMEQGKNESVWKNTYTHHLSGYCNESIRAVLVGRNT
jgi:hypothetical protein